MFRHHPDGHITIGALTYDLVEFLIDEPAYVLPAGMIMREYVPGSHHRLFDGVSQFPGPMPWTQGDAYIAKEAVYTASHQARMNPPKTLTQIADGKRAEIERARDAACVANVTALGRTWQADSRSSTLLGQAITLAQAGLPLPPVWRDANNGDMPVGSLADLLAIGGVIAAQVQAAYSHSWTLKAQVDAAVAANDATAIAAVVW